MTREELRKALWPADTFVDFDNGINTAVNRLREALGDSADNPQFIETVGRRGYRWMPEVTTSAEIEQFTPSIATTSEAARAPARVSMLIHPAKGGRVPSLLGTRRGVAVAAGIVTFLCTAFLSFWWFAPPRVPKVLGYAEITHSGQVEAWGRIVVDGGQLLYLTREGNRFNLVQSSEGGGGEGPVPSSFENTATRVLDMSPDRSEFLVGGFVALESEMPLWIMPAAGGLPRRVGEITATDAVWYPGGQKILFAKGSDLWLVERDGSQARKFASTGGIPERFAWSPDGRVLRFSLRNLPTNSSSLWEVAADGANLHPLLPGWNDPGQECCGRWTPDGKYFLFTSERGGALQIWAFREPSSYFRRHSEPVQLTTGLIQFWDGVLGRDGKRLFAFGRNPQGELLRYESKTGTFVPYLSELRPLRASFSPQRDWIAYTAAPGSSLWRARPDGSGRLQLTFPPASIYDQRWSPDGKQIAFSSAQSGQPTKIYVISRDGEWLHEVVPGMLDRARPDWSPDGKSLVFEVKDAPDPRLNSLYLVDLKTEQVSKLPGSAGMSLPRWSPTGRALAAIDADQHGLSLFDFETRQWTSVAHGTLVTGVNWSRDGKQLYFQDILAAGEPVYRLLSGNPKIERVAGCEKVLRPGTFRCALAGLDADDLPMLEVLRRWTDIYALDLELP